MKSRALVPSVPNVANAAVCFSKLGRYDEALELYEELLTKHDAKITADERASLSAEMGTLRAKVGSVDVLANVTGGMLVIDGRQRGKIPLLSPVRVLPGEHVVHIIAKGHETFQTKVQVEIGQTASVNAKLKVLTSAGTLRVDAEDAAGAAVYVDGAQVGKLPWQGPLAPGAHRFFIRKGDLGSAPKNVVVLIGQTVVGAAKLEPLGGETRILIEPASAEIVLGDVLLGQGRWQGRLPIGSYTISASDEGYFSVKQTLTVKATAGADTRIKLKQDEAHARWGVRRQGEIFFHAAGGVAIAPSLGSGAEQSCDSSGCPDNPAALGFVVSARAGYEFWFGLSVEAIGGYMALSKSITRDFKSSFPVGDGASEESIPTSYNLTDQIRLSGPLAGAGIGYRHMFGERFQLRGNVLVGALFASTSDAIEGTVTASGGSLPVAVDGSGAAASSVSLFVMPELRLGARCGGFSVGAGLALGVFALAGPDYEYDELRLMAGSCDGGSDPKSVQCTPGNQALSAEQSYGTFVMWLPSVSAGYAF